MNLSIISKRVVILSKVSNLYRNSKALSKACLSKIKPDLEDAKFVFIEDAKHPNSSRNKVFVLEDAKRRIREPRN